MRERMKEQTNARSIFGYIYFFVMRFLEVLEQVHGGRRFEGGGELPILGEYIFSYMCVPLTCICSRSLSVEL